MTIYLNTLNVKFASFLILMTLLLLPLLANAQLDVTIAAVKIEGNKAAVKLNLTNNLTNAVESARASVFLINKENKTIGQATHWVIGGGKDKPNLASGGTNTFFFVITSDKPFTTTNLTAKVSFNRLVLQGGVLADVNKNVKVQNAGK